MNAREAIRSSIDIGNMVSMAYLEDMSDDELMRRPHPQCNHIKWQIGHLVSSEHQMIEGVAPGSMPPLPGGFVEKYNKETAASDDPAAFDSKEDLLKAYQQQRAATLVALEKLSDEDLSKPAPAEMQAYAPTVGAAFNMQGGHWLMHAGQWAVLRRQLGRKPLF